MHVKENSSCASWIHGSSIQNCLHYIGILQWKAIEFGCISITDIPQSRYRTLKGFCCLLSHPVYIPRTVWNVALRTHGEVRRVSFKHQPVWLLQPLESLLSTLTVQRSPCQPKIAIRQSLCPSCIFLLIPPQNNGDESDANTYPILSIESEPP